MCCCCQQQAHTSQTTVFSGEQEVGQGTVNGLHWHMAISGTHTIDTPNHQETPTHMCPTPAALSLASTHSAQRACFVINPKILNQAISLDYNYGYTQNKQHVLGQLKKALQPIMTLQLHIYYTVHSQPTRRLYTLYDCTVSQCGSK